MYRGASVPVFGSHYKGGHASPGISIGSQRVLHRFVKRFGPNFGTNTAEALCGRSRPHQRTVPCVRAPPFKCCAAGALLLLARESRFGVACRLLLFSPEPTERDAVMRVVVYEDRAAADLEPITLTRPVFELLCGQSPLAEKQARYFQASGFDAVVRPHLAPGVPPQAPGLRHIEPGRRGQRPLAATRRRPRTCPAPASRFHRRRARPGPWWTPPASRPARRTPSRKRWTDGRPLSPHCRRAAGCSAISGRLSPTTPTRSSPTRKPSKPGRGRNPPSVLPATIIGRAQRLKHPPLPLASTRLSRPT